jgi:hypothetical protein
MLAEPGPRVQRDVDVRRKFAGDDLAEHDDAVWCGRPGQCPAALDDSSLGDPAASPDQGAVLVVAAQTNRLAGVMA